jgi:hypothetical protein
MNGVIRAVVAGTNHVDARAYDGWNDPLRWPEQDARRWAACLKDRGSTDMAVLLRSDYTRARLVEEMQARMNANIAMLSPEELMKNWTAFGAGAQEHFSKLMTQAAGMGMGAPRPK